MNYPPAQDRRRTDGQPTSKSPLAPIIQIASVAVQKGVDGRLYVNI